MLCTNERFNELVVTVVVGLGGHEEGAPPRHLRTPLEVFRRMPQLIRLIYIIFYYFDWLSLSTALSRITFRKDQQFNLWSRDRTAVRSLRRAVVWSQFNGCFV